MPNDRPKKDQLAAESLSKLVVETAYKIHRDVGPGLLESVYESILQKALEKQGLTVETQVTVPFHYDGMLFESGLRIDLLVDNILVVELKSHETLSSVHKKQLLTCLRLMDLSLGLLINFGSETFKEGCERVVNHHPDFATSRLRVNQIPRGEKENPESAQKSIRKVETAGDDFPILARKVNGKRLVYLDSAASTQKPRVVIDSCRRYYEWNHANVHRAVHLLSQEATGAMEGARKDMRKFLGAEHDHEVIFVRGATEAINLVAQAWGRANLNAGDEVLVTGMEHHSNIVPWQMIAGERGAKLVVVPVQEDGSLLDADWDRLIGPKTKMVGVVHVSNALGTINPVADIIRKAHAAGAKVLVDGAQAVAHLPVDVRELDADFYALSGHKMYAPTGIGVLYGKTELLDAMPPWQGGGDMIRSVTFEKSDWNDLPYKFEAGTPHIAGAVGLGAAATYLQTFGMEQVARHEKDLFACLVERLEKTRGIRLIGTARERTAVASFLVEGVHPHDVGTILDTEGVAIRTGHHCAQPVMDRFCIPATCRASLGIHNTREDIDAFVAALEEVRKVFA